MYHHRISSVSFWIIIDSCPTVMLNPENTVNQVLYVSAVWAVGCWTIRACGEQTNDIKNHIFFFSVLSICVLLCISDSMEPYVQCWQMWSLCWWFAQHNICWKLVDSVCVQANYVVQAVNVGGFCQQNRLTISTPHRKDVNEFSWFQYHHTRQCNLVWLYLLLKWKWKWTERTRISVLVFPR